VQAVAGVVARDRSHLRVARAHRRRIREPHLEVDLHAVGMLAPGPLRVEGRRQQGKHAPGAQQRAQDSLLADAAKRAFGKEKIRLLKNDRDAKGNIYGSQENYSAEYASSWRLWLWRGALVAMLPSFGNLLIDLVKATSLVSLITITELTFSGRQMVVTTGRSVEVWTLVLLLYFAMAYPLTWIVRSAERYAARYR
jgi:hypothetical protein